MSRASRQEKTEKKLQALELKFEHLLREALPSCAGGRWGLLGQYPEQYRLKEVDQLEKLGQEVVALRQELGIVDEILALFAFSARLQHPRLKRPR